jgi:adenine C2-methylase RlmN of 23S rRNA A2503 and tRNA A37
MMIEYVVLKDVNDSVENGHQLGKLLTGRSVLVNLIPFNHFEGKHNFQVPDPANVQTLADILYTYGVRATVRHQHGKDIAAACGQLATFDQGPSSKRFNPPTQRKRPGALTLASIVAGVGLAVGVLVFFSFRKVR